ncbi:hypothetical protein DFH06DRAFT_1314425 [Mycena polygramma]|nr:hypothetical protein DFH06DRAFT_1314425 [Mycena polygramma]
MQEVGPAAPLLAIHVSLPTPSTSSLALSGSASVLSTCKVSRALAGNPIQATSTLSLTPVESGPRCIVLHLNFCYLDSDLGRYRLPASAICLPELLLVFILDLITRASRPRDLRPRSTTTCTPSASDIPREDCSSSLDLSRRRPRRVVRPLMFSCWEVMLTFEGRVSSHLALNANFRTRRKKVSSEENDPSLGDGWSSFVNAAIYYAYLVENRKTKQPRNTCVAHDTVDRPDREWRELWNRHWIARATT